MSDLFRKIAKADVSYPKWISDSAVSMCLRVPTGAAVPARSRCHMLVMQFCWIGSAVIVSPVSDAAYAVSVLLLIPSTDLLQHIFDPNPKTRITLAEIQCHPWFSR